jgi:HSP20 family protein
MEASNTTVSKTSRVDQASSVPRQALAPAVDITESESGITLLADMPGVSKDRLAIQVEGDTLTIEGRAQIDVPENIALLHNEVRRPHFRRTFTLSRDLDPGKIEASLRHGVLHLRIPKSEAAQPRRIEVKVA